MLSRILDIVAGGHDRDRPAAADSLQRTSVSATVDSTGQTGDHVYVRVGQLPAERGGRVAPRRRGVACPDDRRPSPFEQGEVALAEQHGWRQRVVAQQRRVIDVAVEEYPQPQSS